MRSFIGCATAALSLLAVSAAADQVCNNAAALCGKQYDDITHLGAHDSPFVRKPDNLETPAGDQFYNSTTQLDGGVRMLTAQVHKDGNDYKLCHTNCLLYDAGLASDWLTDIREWLDRNPNEVVTLLLVNSDNADAATLAGLYKTAKADTYAFTPNNTHAATPDWPTLGEMIATNKRLVTFVANLDPASNTAAPYLLDEFTFIFENSYHNDAQSAYSCTIDRPSSLNGDIPAALAKGYMPLTNHFLYDKLGSLEISAPEHADTTNAASGDQGNLGDALKKCRDAYAGRAPTFVLTDFSNVGPAVAAVDEMNGVAGQTAGRRALPTTVAETLDAQSGMNATSNSTMTTTMSKTMVPTTTSTPTLAAPAAAVPTRAASHAHTWRHAADAWRSQVLLVLVAGGVGAVWLC